MDGNKKQPASCKSVDAEPGNKKEPASRKRKAIIALGDDTEPGRAEQHNCQFEALLHIADVTSGEKNAQKKESALNHFDYFLQNSNFVSQASNKRLRVHDDVQMCDIDDIMTGKFATYLAKEARVNCNPKSKLLKFLSSYGYLSAWKMHYLKKYRSAETSVVFSKEKWSLYMGDLKKEKMRQARLNKEVSFFGTSSPFVISDMSKLNL